MLVLELPTFTLKKCSNAQISKQSYPKKLAEFVRKSYSCLAQLYEWEVEELCSHDVT